ncbi:MAG: hypothetical protein O2890_13275 [Cyanobacteria bacterium]|nr:hypothetical protein [Cyanobacteriota bacterium]
MAVASPAKARLTLTARGHDLTFLRGGERAKSLTRTAISVRVIRCKTSPFWFGSRHCCFP